jgi:EAL and modified HD-GYP domain-containing signal transduction protein
VGRLLDDLNAAAPRYRIGSLRQAAELLGADAFRRLVALVALGVLGEEAPGEGVVAALVRARMCELVARDARADAHEAFLTGLVSCLEPLAGRPLEALCWDLSLPQPLVDALLRHESPAGRILQLARSYERGAFADAARLAASFGLAPERLSIAYRDAIGWAGRNWR